MNMSAASPSATLFSLNYDFHNGNGSNGNVWGITNNKDTTRNQTFTYDALNRLTSAQNAGTDCSKATLNGRTEYWGNSYSYDAWGNLLTKTPTKCSAENITLTASANNQLQGYSYDATGNMMQDLSTGYSYTYDQENRITGAAGYTYTYDEAGNRVEKSNGSTGTLYWYMTPGIVAESDLSGNLQSEYVFFDGERVARRDFPSGSVAYYFSDNLKTASVITDATGNIKSESDYYPWGGELQFANSDSNHYKFTGKERDSETGLDYFGARHYSNGLGRFITPDWAAKATTVPYADFADPQSLNLYTYVRNIPTTKADLDGHTIVLDNTKRADRLDTQKRVTGTTTKAEQKLFKREINPTTGKVELKIDADKEKSFKGDHTTAYNRLAAAIGNTEHTISVGIHDTYTASDGSTQPTPRGGITIGPAPGIAADASVSLNSKGYGNGNNSTLAGHPDVRVTNSIVAAHEVAGHAAEIINGGNPAEKM